jgi:hypothetical protein
MTVCASYAISTRARVRTSKPARKHVMPTRLLLNERPATLTQIIGPEPVLAARERNLSLYWPETKMGLRIII